MQKNVILNYIETIWNVIYTFGIKIPLTLLRNYVAIYQMTLFKIYTTFLCSFNI